MLLQLRLFKDTLQGAGRKVIVWVAGNGDSAGFRRVFELHVASACGDFEPAIIAKQPQDLAHLHGAGRPSSRSRNAFSGAVPGTEVSITSGRLPLAGGRGVLEPLLDAAEPLVQAKDRRL